eukprot:Filipodium_phascolosomae@DN2714_c2_g1_i13.p1
MLATREDMNSDMKMSYQPLPLESRGEVPMDSKPIHADHRQARGAESESGSSRLRPARLSTATIATSGTSGVGNGRVGSSPGLPGGRMSAGSFIWLLPLSTMFAYNRYAYHSEMGRKGNQI